MKIVYFSVEYFGIMIIGNDYSKEAFNKNT